MLGLIILDSASTVKPGRVLNILRISEIGVPDLK